MNREVFDYLEHGPFQVVQYVEISESENCHLFVLKELSARRIFMLLQCMLTPVHLDDQT